MYPGYNTQFYIVLQQVVTGPITGLADLSTYHIAPDTPVWYDGLDDWKPAIVAPLTSQLFTSDSEFYRYMAAQQRQQEESIPAVPVADEEIPAVPVQNEEPPVITRPQRVQPEKREPRGPQSHVQRHPRPVRQRQQPAPEAMTADRTKPSNYLAGAIVVAVVFNIVCGVIAIIYSCKVNSKFNQGNMASAEKCSELTQWWIAIGICVGLIIKVAQMFIGKPFFFV